MVTQLRVSLPISYKVHPGLLLSMATLESIKSAGGGVCGDAERRMFSETSKAHEDKDCIFSLPREPQKEIS